MDRYEQAPAQQVTHKAYTANTRGANAIDSDLSSRVWNETAMEGKLPVEVDRGNAIRGGKFCLGDAGF
ncbi:MAG: hypothetical protein U9Q68_06990 [Euryarchaeota archaeon]|nr:hypothetical protein [Euryarchaeota archaeon]